MHHRAVIGVAILITASLSPVLSVAASEIVEGGPGRTLVAPDNPAFVYSPYNWTRPTRAVASTINAGAYLRIMYSGTGAFCTLSFDTATDAAPFPQIYVRIDAYEAGSSWTRYPVGPHVPCAPSAATSAQSFHLVELMVKSTSATRVRWSGAPQTIVSFTGMSLPGGARVVAPATFARRWLFYGDSITEGVRDVNMTATDDTDRNDTLASWSWALGKALGAEFGIVAFGGSGLTVAGSGGVPPLPISYDLVMLGVPRTFSPCPDGIVINEGTNGHDAPTAAAQSALTQVLSGLRLTCANAFIAVLRPFNGAQAVALKAAVMAAGSPRIAYIDTTGFLNPAYGSVGVHPTSGNDVGMIAPKLLNAIRAAQDASTAQSRGVVP